MIPPGSRGMPHFHDGHETAIYTVSGRTEVWHGHGLVKRTVVRAGAHVHPAGDAAPAGEPGDVTAIAVVARTDPTETRRAASSWNCPVTWQTCSTSRYPSRSDRE